MADKGPGAMLQKIVDDMPERTGKTFPAWVKIAKKDGPDKQMACVKWLKQTHSLLHNQALVVAAEAVGNSMLESYSDEGALLDKMYSGKKEHLRPLHDAAEKLFMALGREVTPRVCKTYVSYTRERQFALIQPTTQSVVDVGLCLPADTTADSLIEPVKNLGGGERFNFRIRVTEPKDLKVAGVKKWMKAAWEHGVKGS